MKNYRLTYIEDKTNKEEELTIEKFISIYPSVIDEFTFYYQQYVIYISVNNDDQKNPYILSIEYPDRQVDFSFESVDDLVNGKVFNKQTLKDIWNLLEN